MDWMMFWFWVGVILILAAALVPNEKYNWGSLLYSAINNFLAKREAKKYPDFVARWKEYNVKEKELEKFYNEKIIETSRNIQRCSTVLCHLEEDDFRKGIVEETLKEDRDELLEYETLYQEISRELDKEFQQLQEERQRLGIKHI